MSDTQEFFFGVGFFVTLLLAVGGPIFVLIYLFDIRDRVLDLESRFRKKK